MRFSRLLHKALASLILVFGLTVLASALSTAWFIETNMTAQFEARGRAIADSIANASVDIILFRDVSTIQAMIDQYLEIQGASYVFVVNRKGEVISHTFAPYIPEELVDMEHDHLDVATRQIHLQGQGDFLDISSPILAGRIGYVHVGLDQGIIRAAIWSALIRQFLLIGIIFLVSLLAAYLLVRKIAQPLDRLTAYARQVASQDGTAVGVDGTRSNQEILSITTRSDEVGLLAQAFHQMVLEISGREQQLRRARDELETRVQERTTALSRMNETLQDEINERKRAEQALSRQTQELVRSNSELEQFAYVASHDLQEPLRKVQAFGDMLGTVGKQSLNEEGKDYLRRMQNAAQRMQLLINDLLTFSRISSQARPFVKVDMEQTIREVVSDLEARIRTSGGRVDIGSLPIQEGDPMQMRQLLQNLIGNALKFHRPNEPPLVKVWAQVVHDGPGEPPGDGTSNAQCEIFVQDNGIGFEEKYLDRIFSPFQRLHGRGEYEGTGIGLAICRKIAERHGGTITARSAPGKGATFIVRLPLQPRRNDQAAGNPTGKVPPE